MPNTEKGPTFRLVHGQASITVKRKTFNGKVLAVDFGKLIVENEAPLTINKLVQLKVRLFGQSMSLYAFPIFIETKGTKHYAHLRIHGLSGIPLTTWNKWVQFAKANPFVGSPSVGDPITPNIQ